MALSARFSPRRMTTTRSQTAKTSGMRYQHHCDALLLQAMDQAQDLLDLPNRDRGRRLVHHHELGIGEPRPRDRDRLALATRHLLHEVVRTGLRAQLSSARAAIAL